MMPDEQQGRQRAMNQPPRKPAFGKYLALVAILLAVSGCGTTEMETSSGPGGVVPTMLSWQKPSTNDDGSPMTDLVGYQIYYGLETPVTPANSESIAVFNPNQTSYVVWDLAPGTYHFTVTAVNLQGAESSMSNEASKTIL